MNVPIPPKSEPTQVKPAKVKPPKGQPGAVPMIVPGGGRAPEIVKEAATPAKAKQPPPQPEIPVPPTVAQSRLHLRHIVLAGSFVLMVLLPIVMSSFYLWTRAADQYASFVGFSVRTEDASSSLNMLLGPLDLGGGQTPDADILYEFIQSQDLVARIDEKIDLRTIWSKPGPDNDPVFVYEAPGTIENLRDYWRDMVKISYDGGNGMIELRVHAFTPEDAQLIAREIGIESTRLINDISLQAREDAIRYSREDMESALARLKNARRAVTEFRNRHQIVDPTINVAGQATLLSQLNVKLATALIDLDMLNETTREGDPRIDQVNRRIKVIEARIEDEKRKLGIGGGDSSEAEAFASLVGEFEALSIDREFAEQTYAAALATFDAAMAESQRQSRYLAIHQQPTLAEAAEYPQRLTLLGLISLFSFLVWSVLALIGYSLRDRR